MPAEMFDLEKAVKVWAWKEYKRTASSEQKELRKKDLKNEGGHIGLQINWSDVKFKDKTIWPSLTEEELSESETTEQTTSATEEKLSESETTEQMTSATEEELIESETTEQTTSATEEELSESETTEQTTSATEEELSERETTEQTTSATEEEFSESETTEQTTSATSSSRKPTSSKTYSNVLFQTKFYNNTDDSQEYSLKAERTTTSTCETSLKHGFTCGGKMSVTLTSPVILEASAVYNNEMALTNSAGQTFEEKMIWSVESLIRVKGKHVAEASLGVQEKQLSRGYEIKTKVWGYVFVTFTNRRENNVQIKATGHDISEVIKSYLKTEKKKRAYVKLHKKKPMVTITTKGKCLFRFGIKQEIKVDQTPLGSA